MLVAGKELWVVDTEDDSKAGLYMIVFYNGKDYFVFRDTVSAINFIAQMKKRILIFAANLEYDLQNIFRGRIDELRLTFGKSFIVSAKYKNALFYDTGRHWKMSVEEMGRYVGKPKGEFDPTNVEYCKRDCDVTYTFVSEMLRRYEKIGFELRATLPATVLKFWRWEYYQSQMPAIKKEILETWKMAYYGGRTECFFIGKFNRPVRVVDVNSLYPFVMMNEYPYPYSFKKEFNLEGYGVTRATVVSDLEVPILPIRHLGKNVFPNGKFTGWWANDELRYFRDQGGRIVKVFDSFTFPIVSNPFKDYIQDFYRFRKESKDDLMKMTYKLAMNSLYGKFGQGNETYKMMSEERFLKCKNKPAAHDIRKFDNVYVWSEKGEYPAHSNFIWALYTTAYARIHLHKEIMKIKAAGGIVLYCDTDSVFYHHEKNLIEMSDKLGAFKDEGTYRGVEIKIPKVYKLLGEVPIYKAKGVPKKHQKEFFETGKAAYKKPLRLREALRRDLPGNFWLDHTKELRAGYDKGKVLKNGFVEPLTL